ncbi:MAG: tripartite tricarboxylate transporter substrate binding protein [Rubrivivax sp.]
MKRWIKTLLALAGLALAAGAAHAAAWPEKPIKLVVPAPPGGSMDVVARLLAQHLSADLKQTVIVDNKPGAGGSIGIQAMLQAPADGYTLMVTSNNVLVEIPHVMKTPYDPLKDVKPIATFARSGLVLVGPPVAGVGDFSSLVTRLKARQGKGSFASYSTGTSSHYAGLILNHKLGLDLQHVPFAGSPPALLQVMGGQVDLMFDGIATALPQIRAGKLKAYGFTGKARSAYLPDVPTMAELGYPEINAVGWLGIISASGVPEELSAQIGAAVRKVATVPAFNESLKGVGLTPDALLTSAQLRQELVEESGRNAATVRQFNVRID